jgi:hypothetical protein
MQGSTNIYCVNQAENCDPTHPLKTRFYIPPEAIAINHIKVNFKMENYRAYESATEVNSINTTIQQAGSGATNDPVTENVWTEIGTFTTNSSDCDGLFVNLAMSIDSFDLKDTEDASLQYRIYDGTSYYPSSAGSYLIEGGAVDTQPPQGCNGDATEYIPGNQKSKTFHIEVMEKDFSSPGPNVANVNSQWNWKTISRHTHNMSYDIYEDPLVPPVSVTVKVGATTIGTYATDQNDIEITTSVPTAGAWYEVEFTPNQLMRIDGNVYIQIFIQSS